MERSFLTFTVGSYLLGVPSDELIEVNKNLRCTKVPGSPKMIRGILNLRGLLMPVVDMGAYLNINDAKSESFCIILKVQDNNIALGSSLIVAKSEVAIENNAVSNSYNKKESITSASKTKNNDYLVKKGDSLYSISKKYPGVSISDIKKWNNINGEELRPGMKLKING